MLHSKSKKQNYIELLQGFDISWQWDRMWYLYYDELAENGSCWQHGRRKGGIPPGFLNLTFSFWTFNEKGRFLSFDGVKGNLTIFGPILEKNPFGRPWKHPLLPPLEKIFSTFVHGWQLTIARRPQSNLSPIRNVEFTNCTTASPITFAWHQLTNSYNH